MLKSDSNHLGKAESFRGILNQIAILMNTRRNDSLLLLLFLFLFGCHNQSVSPVNTRTDGCVGVSYYHLDNQSSQPLSIDFTALARLNHPIDSPTAIPGRKAALIGQDAAFGSIPRPTDTFTAFRLYSLADGKKRLVYTQQPVQNDLWTRKKENPGDPDFGCYTVSYTLTITDALLH